MRKRSEFKTVARSKTPKCMNGIRNVDNQKVLTFIPCKFKRWLRLREIRQWKAFEDRIKLVTSS